MTKSWHDLLYNSPLDLGLSFVTKDPAQLVVTSKPALPRIILGFLFGVPCLILIIYALCHQGIYIFVALAFCPPLAVLGVLFGLTKQKKTFVPALGKAIKSFQILTLQRDDVRRLPPNGVLSTYKRWSTGGESGGACFVYHVEIDGVEGFGFCIAKDEKRRDAFARELAGFLHYEIRDTGERGK